MIWKRFILTIFILALLAACAPEQNSDLLTQTAEAGLPEATAEVTPTAVPTATPQPTATPEPTATPTPTQGPRASELIQAAALANLSYSGLLDGEPVTLRDGQYRSGAGAAAEISLSDKIAFGYIGDRPLAAVVLASEHAGSGAEYSLHVVGLEAGEPVEIAFASLEDAAQVDSVIIASDQIVLELVTAGPSDAPCCPTQLVVQLFELHGNSLQRTANEVVGVVAEKQQKKIMATATAEAIERRRQGSDTPDSDEAAAEEATPEGDVLQSGEGSGEAAEPENETTGSGESGAEPQAGAAEEVAAEEVAGLDTSLPAGVQPGSVLELIDSGINMKSTGLASTWYWRARPERTTPQEPENQIYPEHVMITFEDDNLLDVVANNGRRVLIFPLHNYLDFSVQNGLSGTGEQIARLQTLVNEADERSGQPRGNMPLLPSQGSPVQSWSRFLDLDFNDGRGVRYVMEGDGDIYTYQGLSDDGRYYVSVIWPLDAGYDDSLLEQLDEMVTTLDIGY